MSRSRHVFLVLNKQFWKVSPGKEEASPYKPRPILMAKSKVKPGTGSEIQEALHAN